MKTTRYIGNCQGCEADHKLRANLLVHHGYERPGHGRIEGDCPAVGCPPYELSCEWTVERVAMLEYRLVGERAHLAGLPDAVTIDRLSWGMRPEILTYALCVTAPHVWASVMERALSDARSNVTTTEREIAHRRERIAVWTLQPVREVDEESIRAEQRAEQAKRNDARRVVREAKQAKADAYKAAQDKRAADRAALLAGFASQFVALAAMADTPERSGAAAALVVEVTKRKHQRFGSWWPGDLGCDDALVTLRLASKSDGDRFASYFFQT